MRPFVPSILILAFIALGGERAYAIRALDPAQVSASVEGDELVVRRLSDGRELERVGVTKVHQGEKSFHWTEESNQSRWAAQGYMDKGEMDFLSTPSGSKQVYGPGFYVSADPLDSAGYGPKGVFATAPRDYFILNESLSHLSSASPAEVRQTHEVLKRAGVFGNRATRTWRVLFDEYAANTLKPIDAGVILESYDSARLQHEGLSLFNDIAAKVPVRPHPAIEAHFPAVQKILLGQALAPSDRALVYEIFENYPYLKNLVEPLLPPDLMTELGLEKALRSRRPLSEILKLDQAVGGLKDSPLLKEKQPALVDLLGGKPLNKEARKEVWRMLVETSGRGFLPDAFAVDLKTDTPLLRRLREEFRPELGELFQSGISPSADLSHWLPQARNWGFGLGELVPGLRDPGGALPKDKMLGETALLRGGLSDFGQKLARSFAFIDHFDLARAVAQGNPEPWKLYDEPGKAPLLERWQKALDVYQQQGNPLKTQEALVGHPVEFRGKRVVAGGDVMLPGEPFGYARMTEEQVAALRRNRFLTVYEQNDPWPQHGGKETRLVRYEYPSAATFKNFKNEISAPLLKLLERAEKAGQLASEQTPEFQDLTKKILGELWSNLQSGDALTRYQARVSVHPFEDYNGRLARLLYHSETGKPLVLQQWDLDLLSHPAELLAHRAQGDNAYRRILQGLRDQEKLNPSMPAYYDTPEIYNTLLDLPDGAQSSVDDLKNFLNNPVTGEMLRKKEITEARWRLWDLEGKRWAVLPEAERLATLKAWMDARFVPEFNDAKLLRQALELSKKLSNGKNASDIAKWWLQAASGPDPLHGEEVKNFLDELEPGWAKAFKEEVFAHEAPLSLPMSATERAALQADVRQGMASATASDATKEKWARLFIRQQIANPADPKRPFDEILKMAAETKDPAFFQAFGKLLEDSRFPERRQLFEAAALLPDHVLTALKDTLLSQLGHTGRTDITFAPEIVNRIARRGDTELTRAFLKHVDAGYLPTTILNDEKVLRNYLGGPDFKSSRARLQRIAEDPRQTQRALQSLADRKEWTDFFALAKSLDLGHVSYSTDPDQKQVKALLKSGLARAAAADPSRGLLANIITAQVETDDALKVAAEDRALQAMLKSVADPSFDDNLALFISGPGGDERARQIIPAVFKEEAPALLQTIQRIPFRVLENIRWQNGWDQAIARAMSKVTPEEQLKLLTHFMQSPKPEIEARLVAAFKSALPKAQKTFLVLAQNHFQSSFPPNLMIAAALSEDRGVRTRAMAVFAGNEKEQSELGDFLYRLLKEGDAEVLKRPLPNGWRKPAEIYLANLQGQESYAMRERWKNALLPQLKKGPGPKGTNSSYIAMLEFLGSSWFPKEVNTEAAYAALEAVYGKSTSDYPRRLVDHEVHDLMFRSRRVDADPQRFYKLYQASRDPVLLNHALMVVERAPYSLEKVKLLAEGLKSQSSDVVFASRKALVTTINMAGDKTNEAQQILRASLEEFIRKGTDGVWPSHMASYYASRLHDVFQAAGMKPDEATARLLRFAPLKTAVSKVETCALHFQRFVPGRKNQALGRLRAKKLVASHQIPSMLKDPAIVAMGGGILVGAAAIADMAYSVLIAEPVYGQYGYKEMREPYTIKALSAAIKGATGIYASGEEWVKYLMSSNLRQEQKDRLAAALKLREEEDREWQRLEQAGATNRAMREFEDESRRRRQQQELQRRALERDREELNREYREERSPPAYTHGNDFEEAQ